MELPKSKELAAELIVLAEVDSTNAELRRRLGAELAEFTVVVTDNQTNGRGRLDRSWQSAPGKSIAFSLLLRPQTADNPLDKKFYGWISLLSALSLVEALTPLSLEGTRAGIKWPNDVLLQQGSETLGKVSGILSELCPDGSVILGCGVNLSQTQEELPVETATSLALAGFDSSAQNPDLILAGFLRRFKYWYSKLLTKTNSANSAENMGLQSANYSDLAQNKLSVVESIPAELATFQREVEANCLTIGSRVRVIPVAGLEYQAEAIGISETGSLKVRTKTGELVELSSGEVYHLRSAS